MDLTYNRFTKLNASCWDGYFSITVITFKKKYTCFAYLLFPLKRKTFWRPFSIDYRLFCRLHLIYRTLLWWMVFIRAKSNAKRNYIGKIEKWLFISKYCAAVTISLGISKLKRCLLTKHKLWFWILWNITFYWAFENRFEEKEFAISSIS